MTKGSLIGLVCALATSLAGAQVALGATNYVDTLIGNGTGSFTGDGGPGRQATVNQPTGMTRLADGSILITDYGNNRVRKLTTAGVISTVVGTGAAASTGDGGPATAAALNGPYDVEVAPDGVSYYVSEYAGNVVRFVSASGTISTVAGTGSACSPAGSVCGDFGDAGAAQLNQPRGLAVASNGDLYIADGADFKVRMVLASSQLVTATSPITTVAGSGTTGSTGDGGPALIATMAQPTDVFPLGSGAFLVSDATNNRIRRVDSTGTMRSYSFAGTCSGTVNMCGDGSDVSLAYFAQPTLLSSDGAGGLLVAEYNRNRVRRIDASGMVSTVIGSGTACAAAELCGDRGPAEVATMLNPRGVLVGADGKTIYFSDNTNRVRARTPIPTNVGPTGPAGPAGPSGATGATGAAGPQGPAGPTGPTGATGAAGATGAQGPAGQTGAAGMAGPPGAAGAAGPDGATGAKGLAGVAGTSGTAGEAGPGGSRGVTGARGITGDQGAAALRLPMTVALPSARVLWPAGRRVRQRVYVSSGSTLTARVIADGHAVAQVRVFVRSGLKQLDFGRLARGRYRIVVVVEDMYGQRASDRISLTVS